MPVWGWLACCVFGGECISCGLGVMIETGSWAITWYMVYHWVHSVGSHLVVTVCNARSLSMSTFWVLTYLVEDVDRQQPVCT